MERVSSKSDLLTRLLDLFIWLVEDFLIRWLEYELIRPVSYRLDFTRPIKFRSDPTIKYKFSLVKCKTLKTFKVKQ